MAAAGQRRTLARALQYLAAAGGGACAISYATVLSADASDEPVPQDSFANRWKRQAQYVPLLLPTPASCLASTQLQLPPHVDTGFERNYKMGPKLGSGAYATVHACEHKKTRQAAAVKIFDKKHLTQEGLESIKEELAIMQSLQHPHIVRVLGAYEDKTRFYLVIELCQGGELFDRIITKTHYSEKEARDVIRTLLDAVAYCHEHQIVHRDIKPENLLLTSKEDDCNIKITDFGIAGRVVGPKSLSKNCGTPGYTAPEVLTGQKYDQRVDYWSIGVIAFILLGGYQPFGEDDKETIEGKCEFDAPQWDYVSDEAKDLIRKLLVKDPRRRLTAKEALRHPWIKKADHELAERDLAESKKGIERLLARRRFKAAVDAVIVTNRIRLLTQLRKESGGKKQ